MSINLRGESRLDDLQIEDPFVRAQVYRDVLAQVEGDPTLQYRSIRGDECYRPDLAAYRIYGVPDLAWLVMLLADVEDEADEIPEGLAVPVLDLAWIRGRIRHYLEGGEIDAV